MEKYYNYDLKKYNFVELINGLFDCENLSNLHLGNFEYELFDNPKLDSETIYHKKFYDKMRSGWPEFVDTYKIFIKDIISKKVGAKSSLIYQKWPTFRVHLPNNIAVGGWHRDRDYNHPPGEINFIVALTKMFESNTTIVESTPGKMDFHQIEMNPGMICQFDGNNCLHGNLPNKTGVARVSFDFRVMLPQDYNDQQVKSSMTRNNKFLIGHYYEEMKL